MYVLVVDGCRPDEAVGAYLPTVRWLAARGTSFAAARSITVAETIPNHVAMSSAPARTMDVAPTVASLFGLPAPSGGWDRVALSPAFTGWRA